MFTINTTCPICRKSHEVKIRRASDYHDFAFGGKHAQDAFPYLSAQEREMLISGICGACWDNLFADEEEDDE